MVAINGAQPIGVNVPFIRAAAGNIEVPQRKSVQRRFRRAEILDLQRRQGRLRIVQPPVRRDGRARTGRDAMPEFPGEQRFDKSWREISERRGARRAEKCERSIRHARVPTRHRARYIQPEESVHVCGPIGIGEVISIELPRQIGVRMNVNARGNNVGDDAIQVSRN